MKARVTLLVTLILCWVCSSTAFAKDALEPEAQRHFEAGLAYADDPSGPKWDEALKEFLAAYAVNPNWKLKNNIGLCSLHLERDGEAIEAYREYLSHGGEKTLSDKHRKQIEKDIATLSASLVEVSIDFEPAEVVIIDERKTANGELRVNRYPALGGKASLGLHPGAHKVTLEAPGYISGTWTFDAKPASTHHRAFKLDPEKQPEATPAAPTPEASNPSAPPPSDAPAPAVRRNYTGVYIGLAATGVFVAAATTTGVLAMRTNRSFNSASDSAEEASLRRSGKTLTLLTDIGIGAAVVSAGVTAYLYFSAPKAVPAKTGKAHINISPLASPSTAGLIFSGKF